MICIESWAIHLVENCLLSSRIETVHFKIIRKGCFSFKFVNIICIMQFERNNHNSWKITLFHLYKMCYSLGLKFEVTLFLSYDKKHNLSYFYKVPKQYHRLLQSFKNLFYTNFFKIFFWFAKICILRISNKICKHLWQTVFQSIKLEIVCKSFIKYF